MNFANPFSFKSNVKVTAEQILQRIKYLEDRFHKGMKVLTYNYILFSE